MSGTPRPNAAGLLKRDYLYRFAAWAVPKMILVEAYNAAQTLRETELQLIARYGETARPKRQRRLGLEQVTAQLHTRVERSAAQLLARECTPEARDFLLRFIPPEKRAAM